MTSLAYPRFIWRSHVAFTAFAAVIIAAMQVIVINLITNLDTGPILEVLMDRLPAAFKVFITEQFLASLSLQGASAFAFNHPLVLALLAIIAIGVPNRHIAGEIETGTLELLLAHPVRRGSLLLSLWSASATILLVMIGVAVAASLTSITLLDKMTPELRTNLIKIAVNLWLLFVLIMSMTVMFATFAKAGNKVVLRSAGVFLLFYLLDILATLWNPLEFSRPINMFSYYQPLKLMFGQRSFWLNAPVLLGAITICLTVSLRQFSRRDIPG